MEDTPLPPLDFAEEQERIFLQIRPDPAAGVAEKVDALTPAAKITEQEIEAWKEQDRFLPIANVGRIMKKCLPVSTKVSKDAKECVQECTSEFISFITSEAAERCLMEKRKTINGEDILFAMTTLGFENYSEALRIYLAKYRHHQATTGKRTGKKARASGAAGGTLMQAAIEEDEDDEDDESEADDE
ncbi:hypothetical protein RQP46_006818 [Phenoliferia psychrophenolica]